MIVDDTITDHLISIGSLKKKDTRKINDKNLFRVNLELLLSFDLKKKIPVLK
jgi:hypothetical protein